MVYLDLHVSSSVNVWFLSGDPKTPRFLHLAETTDKVQYMFTVDYWCE